MLTLINTNRMMPPIGPIGLDYVAGAAADAGLDVAVVDLCLADDPTGAIRRHLDQHSPDLIGLTFRNVDDCFWPSGQSFLPELRQTVSTVRQLSDAPIVLGGVGFSIFSRQIVEHCTADFGICGDGEQAVVMLMGELRARRRFDRVPGLIWRTNGDLHANPPAWPDDLSLPTRRDGIDNATYFRRGGQAGVETKRGCNRKCIYCADPITKGAAARLRRAGEVADEFESLLAQGIDVLHLCDSEFNVPAEHAHAICDELIHRGLGRKVRWYTYMTVVPFDDALAGRMHQAGCVGINFTGDAAAEAMLRTYCQAHRRDDLANAVRLCRTHDIHVMIDLLLGGSGETVPTVTDSIEFMKQIAPDCIGAALGVRIYPHTAMARIVEQEGPIDSNPSIRRHYDGPVDLLQPTFYISSALGERPAAMVRELINGDERFFEPLDELDDTEPDADSVTDHNYNENALLTDAIRQGARGAYWDILRQLKSAADTSW